MFAVPFAAAYPGAGARLNTVPIVPIAIQRLGQVPNPRFRSLFRSFFMFFLICFLVSNFIS
jgi:hypothetical protein